MGSKHTKGRNFEQDVGKLLLEIDGECPDFGEMTTSTGRLGQQTNIQLDCISKNFGVECKARKNIPNWLEEPWEQIQDKADDYGKSPLLAIKANYTEPMYCITESTLRKLLNND